MEGGCLCGSVRYRLLSAPYDAGWCHCRTCQLNSGSPAMAFATVPVDDFVFTEGEALVGSVASSDFGHRRFCTQCGTPLYMRVNHQPETVDFSIATLDEPEKVVPGFHIFYASRIPWAEPGDDLPRHERFRPDTRGL
ncbi:MAG TPA: GFA family protein [Sphingomonas sp.]|nr:GFA family protein [Sphingomonas sp.]